MIAENELIEYINQFVKYSNKFYRKGLSEIIMIYSLNDKLSIDQFNHFKNYIGIEFGKSNINKDKLEKREFIAGRIYPVELNSNLGQKLFEESLKWSEELKDPSVAIKTFPAFLDAATHEKVAEGFITVRPLRDMLNRKKLPKRRRNFKQFHSFLLEKKCDVVACDRPFKVKTKRKRE